MYRSGPDSFWDPIWSACNATVPFWGGIAFGLHTMSQVNTRTFGLGRQGDLVAFATTTFSAAAIAATFGATLPPSPCRLASQLGSL